MSTWKEHKFSEIVEIIKDGYQPDGVTVLNYIGLDNIEQETLRLNSIGKSTDVTSNKFKFKANDVLFGKLRCYFRKVVKPDFDGICSTDIWVCRAKKGFNQNFLFYFLANWDFVNTADSGEGGTRMPRADWEFLKNTVWNTPDLHTQTIIAFILSNLDDKIDLLHRQNKTLEQLAETLFKQWFFEENKSEIIVPLNDYVNCINGVSYKSSELNPSNTALVSLKSFNRYGGFNLDGFKDFTGRYKEQQIVLEGDLVVAHTDITQEADVIGNPALIISSPKHETLVISMDMIKVVPKEDWISKEFLYFLMRSREFKHHCLGCANGTTVLHLSKIATPSFEFAKPEKEKVIAFTQQAKKLVNKIFINHKELYNLISLRDTLLPKLMNGEIKVDMAE